MLSNLTPNTICDNCGTCFHKRSSYITERNYCSRVCYQSRDRRLPVDNDDGTASLILTNGYVATIDSADIDLVSGRNWFVAISGDGRPYVSSKVPRSRRRVFLHRFLLNPPDGMVVDHRNGNGLDNRRSNIRICTQAENVRNNRGVAGKTSQFKGVSFWNGWWIATITSHGKQIRIGQFSTERAAALAYNDAANRLHGEFAYINLLDD